MKKYYLFIGNKVSIEIYMNGSENDSDGESLHIWYVDLQGNLITLKSPSSTLSSYIIGVDVFDNNGTLVSTGDYTTLQDNIGSGIIYNNDNIYIINNDGSLTSLLKDLIFPSIDYDFATLFTCNNDVKITYGSIELHIRDEDTKVTTSYVNGDIITAGTYTVYGMKVDKVKFINDSFISINIIRNSFQTDATTMCISLNLLSVFEAGIDTFSNVTNFDSCWYRCISLTLFPLIDTSSGTNFNGTCKIKDRNKEEM